MPRHQLRNKPVLTKPHIDARMASVSGVPQRCLDCLVRDKALCASMSDCELAALSALGRRRDVAAGQVVTWAGDPNSSCANVVSGALKVSASTADGREQIVGLLFPGDFVGQLFTAEASLTVTALTDTNLCTFPRTGFERALETYPHMERLLLERTMASLDEARERMLSLGRKDARERVAGFLLELAERTGMPDAAGRIQVLIPISRGEMAGFLGLTIETVSRHLTRLKTAGVVDFAKGERDCTILDRAALKAIVNPA